MNGSYHPLTCCDAECAAANHCQVGGVACDGCGNWFCAEELREDGLCDECREMAREEEEEEEEEEDGDD